MLSQRTHEGFTCPLFVFQTLLQKKRCSLLLKLCDLDSLLFCDVTRVLSHSLQKFTDNVRATQSRCAPQRAHLHENVFHVLSCLECVVKKLRSSTDVSNVSNDARVTLLRRVKTTLEDSVLFIWRSHALLSHYIWHIVALIT